MKPEKLTYDRFYALGPNGIGEYHGMNLSIIPILRDFKPDPYHLYHLFQPEDWYKLYEEWYSVRYSKLGQALR